MRRVRVARLVAVIIAVTVVGCSKPQPSPPAKPVAATPPAAAAPAPAPAAPAASEPAAPASPAAKTADAAPAKPMETPAAAAKTPATKDVAAAGAATSYDELRKLSLDELRKLLTTTPDGKLRVAVIDAIASIGQKAHPAIDDLVQATADADSRVRWHAARGLGLIGEESLRVLPQLVKLLGDSDPITATQSATTIGLIREDDGRTAAELSAEDAASYAAATDALVRTAVHPDGRVRRASVRALRTLSADPKTMAALVSQQLGDVDPSVVLPAIHTLADMDGAAVPVLLEALKNPKSRYWATVALTEIGEEAAPAVPLLVAEAETGELDEKLQAILALAAIGKGAEAAVPTVVKAMESKDNSLRFAAAFALGKLGSPEADKSLEAAAADENAFLASIASWARAQIHPDDDALRSEAVTRLRKGLDSETERVRTASISALSDMTSRLDAAGQKELAAEFADLLGDASPAVDNAAGGALIRQGAAAVDSLRTRLANPAVRLKAIEILGVIGPAAAPALGDLVKLLGDSDPQCQGDTALAIAAIGPNAAAAVPELQKMLTAEGVAADAAPGLRYAAAYALGQMGTAASPALATLREFAASPDQMLATVATWAAIKIAPDDTSLFESAVPLFRQALRSESETARLEAASALGDIGRQAGDAIPILELVAEDDASRAVRAAAAKAVAKIKGK